jgi:hypothetical protein
MRSAPALLIATLCVMSGACAKNGKKANPAAAVPVPAKPAAAAPAPAPPRTLSIPQTQVELPRPQPLDVNALAAPQPEPAAAEPAAPAPRTPPPRTRTPAAPVRSEPPAQPPAAVETAPAAPAIQEVLSPGESKRLQESAQSRRREAQAILDQLARRQLSPAQRDSFGKIASFLTSSADAEKRGDLKFADAAADRALTLAKDLVNGK